MELTDGVQSPAAPCAGRHWNTIVALTLIAAAFLVYASTLGHGFIFSWDDFEYVAENKAIQGFTLANLQSVFSSFYVGNYAPLHLLSYMLDYQIWGLNPAGYHLGNIIYHALNGILLYRLFVKLELGEIPALFGAALFVVHPCQVESVAWIAERKNILSVTFFLLAMLSYIQYRTDEPAGLKYYCASIAFFACALLVKSAAVIFPCVILCYDLCYGGRLSTRTMLDKVPFFLLALAAGYMTMISQAPDIGGGRREHPGGTLLATLWTMTPVFLSYLRDLVYPLDLSPYYMILIKRSADRDVITAACILLGLAGATIAAARRWPRILFFISIYILALLPVMQIVPILTLKNDRYQYFPMIGAAGAAAMVMSLVMRGSNRLRTVSAAVAMAVCIALGVAAHNQSLIWKNNLTLWQFAVRQNPDNMLAWLMLAKAHTRLKNGGEAVAAITTFNTLKKKYGPLRGWESN